MKTMNYSREKMNVALLLNDAVVAKNIAQCFRKLDILPTFYQDLTEFWKATISEVPDLCIVDVELMSSDSMLLSEHPHVKDRSMALSFYHTDATTPLVNSTFNIFHYGLVRKSLLLEGQLKDILQRVNEARRYKSANQTLNFQVKDLRQKTGKLIGAIHDYKEQFDFEIVLEELANKIELNIQHDDFIQASVDVFSDWAAVKSIACYELTGNDQKLVSGKYQKEKFTEFPALWLGQKCENGIEAFAENMALEVAKDIMGKNVISLKVHGTKEKPTWLFFLSVDELYYPNFPWHGLEKALTSALRLDELYHRQKDYTQKTSEVLNSWQLLSVLEKEFSMLRESIVDAKRDKHLVHVRFKTLTTFLSNNFKQKFLWGEFYKDFIFQLKRSTDISFQYSLWGEEHLSFVIEKRNFENFFSDTKNFLQRFSYWRYFEDSTETLNTDLTPELSSIPFSPHAYLNIVKGEHPIEKVEVSEDWLKPVYEDTRSFTLDL